MKKKEKTMEISEDNDIILTGEDGAEFKAKILFYYHNDERSADYYFLYKLEDPDTCVVMASDDGESLREVDDEEFEEANEVFEAYNSDPEIQKAKN